MLDAILLSSRKLKTRKKRQCFSCLRFIEIGTYAIRMVGKCEGDFYTNYNCLLCDELNTNFPSIMFGDDDTLVYEGNTVEIMRVRGYKTPEELLENLKQRENVI